MTGGSNQTRGLTAGGTTPDATDRVEYVTLATLGNGTDFGNLSAARRHAASVAGQTRFVVGGGDTVPSDVNIIEYFTIGSTGNATDFGDLSAANNTAGGLNSTTRGLFGGGNPGSVTNTIEQIQIATTAIMLITLRDH